MSESQLVATLHRLADGVLFVDAASRVRYANQAAQRFAIQPAPGSSSVTFWDHFPDLDRDVLDEAFSRVMRTGETSTTRHWMAGPERWLELRAEPTESGLAIILRDVTAD